jgi:fibro-slime domain-containing protein
MVLYILLETILVNPNLDSDMKIRLFLVTALCLGVSLVNAQIYKDTIWVPVTYYDFHSDRSNPEFEISTTDNGTVHQNMVGQILDSEGKPDLGPAPYTNMYIKYWYRPWNGSGSSIHARGDYTIPIYNKTTLAFTQISEVDYDTAFKNIVIHDSLPFKLIPNSGGKYQYENQSFFPLDNKGFGNEGRSHNYSFSMELKWPFQKKADQTFDFSGDDDLWAFVNGKLAMDLGGIHTVANGSFSMNSFPEIPENSVCTLNAFYAERLASTSDIKITTNIISPRLIDGYFDVQVQPDSVICLGDSVIASAIIKRGGQVLTQIPSKCSLQWTLHDSLNPPSALTSVGLKCIFRPIKASTAKITCTLYDSIDNISLPDTVSINVKLCIEPPESIGFYYSPGDSRTMTLLPDTIILACDTTISIYVKMFDANGAWLEDTSISNHIKWTISDSINARISTQGSTVSFKSNVAYKNYVLTAHYLNGSQMLSRSFVIRVLPATPGELLFIEPNPDGLTLSPNHPQPFPDTTITLNSNETVKKAYAVFRDIYGNFIRFSNSTEWTIDKPIASLVRGDTTRGEVIITRIDTGLTILHVTDTKTNLKASVKIMILNLPVRAIDAGNQFGPSHFTCNFNGSKLTISSPQKYVGATVTICDISGRTIDKFIIDATKMNRILGSKSAGARSGLYIITVKGRTGRIVVPISTY